MTEKELRELDAWIAEHVMGWKDIIMENAPNVVSSTKPPYGRSPVGYERLPHFTTFKSSAMEVLEKCADRCSSLDPMIGMVIWKDGGMFGVGSQGWESDDQIPETIPAETLPLAICLFAKQLFSK